MTDQIVLLVEDNELLNVGNRRMLEDEGYTVLTALTLAQARTHLAETKPDVILLDITLPDGSGMDFCREIRRTDNDVHIIFLTSHKTHKAMVEGLETGGDDYIKKPFNIEELLARINAQMRRRAARFIVKGRLVIDTAENKAYLNDKDLFLTGTEFPVLRELAQNEGRCVSHEDLYRKGWSAPLATGDKNALQSAVKRLRKKIGGSGYTVSNKRGEGYIFEKE